MTYRIESMRFDEVKQIILSSTHISYKRFQVSGSPFIKRAQFEAWLEGSDE